MSGFIPTVSYEGDFMPLLRKVNDLERRLDRAEALLVSVEERTAKRPPADATKELK